MRPSWIHLFLDVPADRWEPALAFWSAVSGWTVSSARGETGQFVTLLPEHGGAWLKLQLLDSGEPRVHLDLDHPDQPDQAGAVTASTALDAHEEWTYDDAVVMRSPGGLLFCHIAGSATRPPRLERDGLACVIDQVCIDVPPRLWDTEVAFWEQLTGRRLETGRRREFAVLDDPDPAGLPRILLQRLDTDAPEVSAHLDLAVHDRPAEIARQVAMGARHLEDFEHWTQMLAPSGHVYCLTDRDPATGRVRPTS